MAYENREIMLLQGLLPVA